MKKIFFVLALISSVLAACNKAENSDNGFSRIGATASNPPANTRAHVDFVSMQQVWDAGDCISVFTSKIPNGRQFVLATEEGLSNAEFVSDEVVNDTTCYYALYPASASGKAAFSTYGDALTVNYPASTSFNYDNFSGDCCNFMVAKSNDKFFFFKNIFSYIEFSVNGPDDDAIRSIVVQGQNGEIVSGTAKVTFNGEDPEVSFVSGGKSITVDFGEEGLAFPTEVFDISVPPVLSLGFSVTVNTVKGVSKTFKSAPCPDFLINTAINMGNIDLGAN